ncbi:hypothetical protein CAPTEDRAFT_219452 [Capitella teleta]|uniref:Reverse transcriptase domain-containing protein n=1 Tax=Capitella teleta TaxID=283909 RepID=R7V9H8_CAPTE|nr:hypothetical protein CAPTEDRAFT_219452 [Capitella teleta]|eukprot:ELU15209.1 hypothetical protein CAPTEDRAFT_219452 [Capitella teleta]
MNEDVPPPAYSECSPPQVGLSVAATRDGSAEKGDCEAPPPSHNAPPTAATLSSASAQGEHVNRAFESEEAKFDVEKNATQHDDERTTQLTTFLVKGKKEILARSVNTIYRSGEFPKDCLVSIFIPLPKEFGMQLNAKKTKTMCVSRMEPETIQLRAEGKALEQVHQYIYLGVTITQDMRQEIKRRIAIAKSKFLENKEFPRRNLCLNIKKKLLKIEVPSSGGAETKTEVDEIVGWRSRVKRALACLGKGVVYTIFFFGWVRTRNNLT